MQSTMINNLSKTFSSDLDSLIKSFIDDYGLKYEEKDSSISSPLVRWLDFTTRYIPSNQRKIYYSSKFPKTMDDKTTAAFENIESIIKSGGDINPYQSKGLIIHNDTSGQKRQQRTDLLFADWGIHHLHLSDKIPSGTEYFSKRSEWLLFCIFGEDSVGFIDVRHHNEQDLFSDSQLIKEIAVSWPEYMNKFKVDNFTSISGGPQTSGETSMLRKAGITSVIQIDDAVYLAPGMGVTTASTSTRASMQLIRINRLMHHLADLFSTSEGQYQKELKSRGIANPDFHIALTKNGLCVHERVSNQAYILSRAQNTGLQNWISELHELLLPQWAHEFLLKKSGGT